MQYKDIRTAFDELYLYDRNTSYYTHNLFMNVVANTNESDKEKLMSDVLYVLSMMEDQKCYSKIQARAMVYSTLTLCVSVNKLITIAVENNFWQLARYIAIDNFITMKRYGCRINVRGNLKKKFYAKFGKRLLYNTRRDIKRYICVLNFFDTYAHSEDFDYVIERLTAKPEKILCTIHFLKCNKKLSRKQKNNVDAANILLNLNR